MKRNRWLWFAVASLLVGIFFLIRAVSGSLPPSTATFEFVNWTVVGIGGLIAVFGLVVGALSTSSWPAQNLLGAFLILAGGVIMLIGFLAFQPGVNIFP